MMLDRFRAALRCTALATVVLTVGCDDSVSTCTIDAARPSPCSGLFTLLVVPAQTTVGGSVSLAAMAGEAAGGKAYAVAWSAPRGVLSSARGTTTDFTCTAPGAVTVTFTAMLPTCIETLSAAIDCGADLDGGTDADGTAE